MNEYEAIPSTSSLSSQVSRAPKLILIGVVLSLVGTVFLVFGLGIGGSATGFATVGALVSIAGGIVSIVGGYRVLRGFCMVLTAKLMREGL